MKRKTYFAVVCALFFIGFILRYAADHSDGLFIASQKEGEGGLMAGSKITNKKVYLTFDDGPSENTDEILDILKKNKVKATFFVVGKKTEKARKQYQRIVLEGHTLAMHSYSHNYDQIYSSVDAFGKDIKELQEMLYEITDVKPVIYRFPGGSSNSCAGDIKPYIQYINKEGLLYFDWNALSGDAVNFNLSPESLNQNILTDVKKQKVSIVLMHDLAEAENTVKSLDSLIKTLKKEGYQILPITKYTQQIHHVSVDK